MIPSLNNLPHSLHVLSSLLTHLKLHFMIVCLCILLVPLPTFLLSYILGKSKPYLNSTHTYIDANEYAWVAQLMHQSLQSNLCPYSWQFLYICRCIFHYTCRWSFQYSRLSSLCFLPLIAFYSTILQTFTLSLPQILQLLFTTHKLYFCHHIL